MKIAFLFPGQGSQFIGMGRDYYKNFSDFRNLLEEISDYTQIDIKSLVFNEDIHILRDHQNSQISLFAVCLGIFNIIKKMYSKNIDFYAGHSFGEITAYTASRVFSKKVASILVINRGNFMKEITKNNMGGMLAIIGRSRKKIKRLCQNVSSKINPVFISAFNSPIQIVLSGYKDSLKFIQNNIHKYDSKAIPLNVQGALHSPLISDIKNQLENFLQNIPIKKPFIPTLSSYTGDITLRDHIKKSISINPIRPVLWENIIQNLLHKKVQLFIEISPKNILQNLLKQFNKNIQILGTQNLTHLKKTLSILNTLE